MSLENNKRVLDEQRAILENRLVGISTVQDRTIVWANSAFETMLGYDRYELIGVPTRQLYVNEEDYQSMGVAYATIEANGIVRSQIEFMGKDDRHIWLDTNGSLLDRETGKSLWIFVDITDRKVAETQQAKSLSLLSATLDSTRDAILVVDLNNTWVSYNRKFIQLWHITDEILCNMDDSAALTYVLNQLEAPDDFLNKVRDLYASPKADSFDILKFKDGKIIERYSIPQYIDDKVVGRVWSFSDVTNSELTKQALKIENEKNLALLRNASDGIHILDTQGNIIEVSDSFCAMLGYQRDEMIGMNLVQWDVNPSNTQRIQQFRQQFQKPVRSQFESRHRRKDGTIIDVEISGFPLELNGKPVLFNSSRDITERKQTERQLSSSENKYRSLVELAGDAIFLADIATGTIVDCNKNATELLGKTKDEIIGLHQSELHPTDKTSFYQKVFKNHIETGNEIAEDLLVVHKDGHTIPVDIRATVIKLEDVTLILGVFRYIARRKQQNDELNRTKKRYDLATSIGKIGIWDWNLVTGDLVWNDETFRILGFKPNALHPSYELFLDRLHPKDRKNLDRAVQAAHFDKKGYSEDCRVLLENGEERICHATGEVEFNEVGEPVRMLGTFQDITERKQAEEALRISATAFESQEGVLVTDANQAILRVNHAFTNITGYTAEEVKGKTPRILSSGRHDTHFFAAMWDCINNTGSWQGEIWNRRKDGEIYPEFLAITEVTGQNGMITNYVATFTDISVSKAAADKIEYLAFYDPLTGLPNRRLLQDRLKKAMASSHRSGRQGGLLFMDADNFKILNDTLGHDKGDLLLQLIARRLEPCVRECDTVARLGGDEFVLMLENLSEQTLEAAAQIEVIGNKILATLNQPYLLGMNEYRNTASIGATLFNGHEQSADELLKLADIAMYQAKASGRNVLRFFDPQMQATINARVELEADLRLAFKENQFTLYYQPQVCHNRQILGAEVLVRWQHPQRGLVFPADFIPLAEETNLILPIGQWVLETACAQIKMWEGSKHTRHLELAVNVSACQFYQADFVEQVTQAISRNMITPDKLKLELTESLVLKDIDDTISKMKALRQIGVLFSMDDFGTGYSSLSSLKKLPISQLKIDQSFVRDILNDTDDMIIVRTIIAMAKNMGLSVIAEGVETEAQRVFLEQHDCSVFQGYLFSKPVPIDQFELLLKRNLKLS